MRYKDEEFFRLMDAIEADGGQHLNERHGNVTHPELTGEHRLDEAHEVHYCNVQAQFEVPYLYGENDAAGVISFIKVCAVDDCIGLWPRYASANAPGEHSE